MDEVAVRLAFEAANEFEAAFRRDPLLPDQLVSSGFAGPTARRLFLDLLDALGSHDELADASLFSTYRNTVTEALTQETVTEALTQEKDAFWHSVFAQTSSAG